VSSNEIAFVEVNSRCDRVNLANFGPGRNQCPGFFPRQTDKGRAYHSAYFEMLGEQGYIGFLIWAMIHGISLARTEWLRRFYLKRDEAKTAWVPPLALALQQGHIVYALGALFIGIAYQPFVFMLLALQIGLDTYLTRLRRSDGDAPIFAQARNAEAAA